MILHYNQKLLTLQVHGAGRGPMRAEGRDADII